MVFEREAEKESAREEGERVAEEWDDACSGLRGGVGEWWEEEEGEVVDYWWIEGRQRCEGCGSW